MRSIKRNKKMSIEDVLNGKFESSKKRPCSKNKNSEINKKEAKCPPFPKLVKVKFDTLKQIKHQYYRVIDRADEIVSKNWDNFDSKTEDKYNSELKRIWKKLDELDVEEQKELLKIKSQIMNNLESIHRYHQSVDNYLKKIN